MLTASMYAFIAPVTAHTASTKPTTVSAMLDVGCASARSRELLRSDVACAGMNVLKCCIRLTIVPGPAINVKRPTTTSSTDGIAKKLLYASADASIIALSSRNLLPALTTTAFQSANVRSRRPGSRTGGSRRSGCGPGVMSSSGASSGSGRAVSRLAGRVRPARSPSCFARKPIDSPTLEAALRLRAMV